MIRRRQVKPADIPKMLRAYRHLVGAGVTVLFRSHQVSRWTDDRRAFSSESIRERRTISRRERQTIADAARWTDIASRHPWQWARCLQRSIAVCQWLEKEGIEPRLVIGVRRAGNGISGHAWVEYAGEIVNDVPGVRREFATLRQSELPNVASVDRWEEESRRS